MCVLADSDLWVYNKAELNAETVKQMLITKVNLNMVCQELIKSENFFS